MVGSLYPNLFAYDISDLHSYIKNGKLTKTNCYSTFYDLISGKSNQPIIFQNFARKIVAVITDLRTKREILSRLKDIEQDLEVSVRSLKRNVESAQAQTGSVRAEFRISISDFTSLVPFLDAIFNADNLCEWTCALKSSNVTQLAKFYIELLIVPIRSNFAGILREIGLGTVNNHFIMERIASISLLESLLTATLFSGTTFGFASELVWNKSNITRQSLELMKFIRSHNRPVFQENIFRNSEFIVAGNGELLELIFRKITRSNCFNFPPINNIVMFNDSNSTAAEKAIQLWKIYFNELNPNAFIEGSGDRWKIAAVNQDVITGYIGLYPFFAIVDAVFNFESFHLHGSWKSKYYMIQAEKWIKQKDCGITRDILKNLLVQAIRDMGIKHIHYPGGKAYNANLSKHMKVDLRELTSVERIQQIPALARTQQDVMIEVLNSFSKVKRWENSEKLALLRGVEKYGEGKWTKILSDNEFLFANPRQPHNLGAKWNQMKVTGDLYRRDGRWIIDGLFDDNIGNFIEQLPLLDSIHVPILSNSNPQLPSNSISFPATLVTQQVISSEPDSVFENLIRKIFFVPY